MTPAPRLGPSQGQGQSQGPGFAGDRTAFDTGSYNRREGTGGASGAGAGYAPYGGFDYSAGAGAGYTPR